MVLYKLCNAFQHYDLNTDKCVYNTNYKYSMNTFAMEPID